MIADLRAAYAGPPDLWPGGSSSTFYDLTGAACSPTGILYTIPDRQGTGSGDSAPYLLWMTFTPGGAVNTVGRIKVGDSSVTDLGNFGDIVLSGTRVWGISTTLGFFYFDLTSDPTPNPVTLNGGITAGQLAYDNLGRLWTNGSLSGPTTTTLQQLNPTTGAIISTLTLTGTVPTTIWADLADDPPESAFAGPDYGDLPDVYGTLIASGGPVHLTGVYEWLGSVRDSDSDGIPSLNADGDDLSGLADDDGVIFDFINGKYVVSISVFNHLDSSRYETGNPAKQLFLNGFIDANSDGDFSDPGETLSTVALDPLTWSTDTYIHEVGFLWPGSVPGHLQPLAPQLRHRRPRAGRLHALRRGRGLLPHPRAHEPHPSRPRGPGPPATPPAPRPTHELNTERKECATLRRLPSGGHAYLAASCTLANPPHYWDASQC